MTSRRQFLAASAAAGAFTAFQARAAKTSPTGFPYTEFEARIARRDFRGMTKDVLPTPCMVIDEVNQKKSAGVFYGCIRPIGWQLD